MNRTNQYPTILLDFLGDTFELVRTVNDNDTTISYQLKRRASIKDIIEGLGVPHTEVGRISLEEIDLPFELIPEGGEHFHIHPLSPDLPPTQPTVLRPKPLESFLFMVDINVNRLAGLLRMAGFDTCNVPDESSEFIVEKANHEKRILLTRNKELLKHRRVIFGRLVRNQTPYMQLEEIIHVFGIKDLMNPFTRCMNCNGVLATTAKEKILDRLLPLTKKYYDHFMQCQACDQIYWRGSHHQNMIWKIKELMQ